MAQQTHLRLFPVPPDSEQIQSSWITIQDGTAVSGIMRGELESAADSFDKDNVIVYIPTIDIFLTEVNLPAGRKAQLREALPYALEESLTEDVDKLHCALGTKLIDGSYAAAVVDKKIIQQWIEILRNVGISPRAMYADIALLPAFHDSWSISCLDTNIHIRTGRDEGFVCQAAMLPRLIRKALDHRPAPKQVHLYGCEIPDMDKFRGFFTEDCEIVPHNETSSGQLLNLLLEEDRGPTSSLNLLQNEFAPRSQIIQKLRPWYTTAALAAALLVFGFIGNVVEYVSLNKQNQALEQEIRQTFQNTFPDVKRIVNPQAQMRHRLSQLSGNAGSGPGFSEMLAKVAPITARTPKTSVSYLRYQKGQMELLLELPDLQTLEALKNRLSEGTPWQVELKSANSSENKVQGRLLIYKK